MLSLLLHRHEPARNMDRFYRLRVQRELFGGWSLLREWGRRGASGQVRQDHYAAEGEARAAGLALARRKLRRGYRLPPGSALPEA
ncbi:WGR domain-containing protein [Roseomonas sp. GC11]|uniref:WGR domain-containing protein n=1 Tax=Roseomonas sp. GC11 TaxID=2950546 RepID=UPI002109328F|nr:WGR domain-containing protein [Roseomonas sp. GC11]MCQ4159972.1 WGR domain-containing protein [Roseomonas sp. GC11]